MLEIQGETYCGVTIVHVYRVFLLCFVHCWSVNPARVQTVPCRRWRDHLTPPPFETEIQENKIFKWKNKTHSRDSQNRSLKLSVHLPPPPTAPNYWHTTVRGKECTELHAHFTEETKCRTTNNHQNSAVQAHSNEKCAKWSSLSLNLQNKKTDSTNRDVTPLVNNGKSVFW